ncbi:MAG: SEC-C metal-binding domain-containing protein [Myxococcota bacterium]|nr:SEC-C metal-binding domain-containing protein [Myxococcota bacterium]
MKLGRNDVCRCGSGQKYKKCCLPADEAARGAELAADLAAKAEASSAAAEESEGGDGDAKDASTATAKPAVARTQRLASRRATIPVAHRLPRRGAV